MIRVAGPEDAAFVSGIIGVDATECMSRVTTLLNEHGGFFLDPVTTSILEAHMFFKPEGRGKGAICAAREGLRYAFNEMGAAVIFGRIPVDDRAARLMTRMIGFRSDGVRPRQPDGVMVEWFEMRRDECPQQ